jgi:polyketide cyclase/dehydrase/lipid transport protein
MSGHDDLEMHGSAELFIAAPREVLYGMVSDVTRMGEWSPDTVACRWLGADGPRVGARFAGDNRAFGGEWTMIATVTANVPASEFAFVTGKAEGPATHWCYRFEEAFGGTRVTESFEWRWRASDAGFRAQVGAEPIEVAGQMVAERRDYLVDGMRTTLANLKRVAENDTE